MVTTASSGCDPAWQRRPAYNDSVKFDADIVGPGYNVIASLIASSLTALVALIIPSMTCSIPTEFLNDIDGVAVRVLRRAFASLQTGFYWPNATETVEDEARDDRFQALPSRRMSTSPSALWTFVIALACLACTVQLAMMPLLIGHHVTQASRSILMLAGAIMLVTLLALQFSDTWWDDTHIYFRCAVFVYAHTLFMLAYAVAFGWGLAAGPPEAVWALGAVMLVTLARRIIGFVYFILFVRWYRGEMVGLEKENALGSDADVGVDAQRKTGTGGG
ncbi:hypothetical protein BJY00DRAFT_309815 [Aspergillus carlsbadensis]|nr:hypothetical protein BJY00DRAFT_309815 [Aspergillus carlsbadensis]